MSQSIELCRDDAELLDTLLLEYVGKGDFDPRAISIAADLCRTWGMAPWPRRQDSPVSAQEWEKWKDYA